MNKTKLINFIKIFLLVDISVVFYSIIFNDNLFLLNTQIAFISSMIITSASYLSYKKTIQKQLMNIDPQDNQANRNLDDTDEADDPYSLYSKDTQSNSKEELSPEMISKILKEEKKQIKQNTLKNIKLTSTSFISIYRVAGYAFLIFGFFVLNNNHIFLSIPFIIGISIVPFGVLLSNFIFVSKEDQ